MIAFHDLVTNTRVITSSLFFDRRIIWAVNSTSPNKTFKRFSKSIVVYSVVFKACKTVKFLKRQDHCSGEITQDVCKFIGQEVSSTCLFDV